ncbi:MAG: cation:proton antiporter [Pseudomonadota bacterium]
MESHAGLPYLREVLLFLVLAGVLIPLLQRLRLNQVLGFLFAGAMLGPFGLGRLASEWSGLSWVTIPRLEGAQALAELGVVFLLFRIGLELSFERLWALRRWVFGVGSAQVLLSAAVIGVAAAWLGQPAAAAVLLGLVLALSSTALVVQLLGDRLAIASPLGRATFAVLLLQDLAVVPLLILVGVLAGDAPGGVSALVGAATLKAVVAIGIIYLLGRRVIRPLFRTLVAPRQPEVFMALTLLSTLGIGALTWAAGLSMALGAFLAGLLLSETEFRHEVEVTIDPFKGLLMGIFFLSIGMGIDVVTTFGAHGATIFAGATGLLAVKAGVAAFVLRAGGLPRGQALHGGLLLSQGGEFAFIVVGAATAAGVLAGATGPIVLAVVWLTLLVTPALDRIGTLLSARLDPIDAPAGLKGVQDAPELDGHVVVTGFGRVGQLISQVLDRQQVPWLALDSQAQVAAQFHRAGQPVYYGDASRGEMLRRLRLDRALAVVMTMDSPAAALAAVRAVRDAAPGVPVLARSRDEAHAAELRAAGATLVIPETLETGLQLAQHVLVRLEFPVAVASAVIDAERERRMG